MTKRGLYQINLIPRKRSVYALVGLILASILFATCATVFIGVYSYINTYLGESDDTLILTQRGTGNFIATRYISLQVADSADYLQGVTLVSPETLTPCMVNDKTCFVRGIRCERFYALENLLLDAGRFLTDGDIYGAFIGSRAANRLQISLGDSFIIYSGLRDVNLQVTAIGIFSSGDIALNDEIIVPLYAGQLLSGNYPNRITYIRVKYNETIISRNVLEERLVFKHDLSVYLSSNETNMPIENGKIDIYDLKGNHLKTGYTDSLGESLFSLDFGNYTVTASFNQVEVNSSIYLETDKQISLTIADPPTLFLQNVKLLNVDQAGIPFTTVIAWKGSEIIQMRQTNSAGEANFSLPSNNYQFSTLIWNNVTQELVEFRQTANPIQNESLIFWYRHFRLGVRTSDPYSGEFLNTTVVIKLMNGTILGLGVTGELGYTEFEDLTPTSYNVSATYGTIQRSQIIELRSDRTVNFEILPQFDLQVHVFNDSNKAPINNSYIQIIDSSDNHFESFSDINGVATFLLHVDNYNITVQSGGFSRNRIIYLSSERNETFFMPPYNFTVMVYNGTDKATPPISSVNVTIFDNRTHDYVTSSETVAGISTFLLNPDQYNISVNISNQFYLDSIDLNQPDENLTFYSYPYNLTIILLNGTTSMPQPNLQVQLYDLNNSLVAGPDITDSQGQISYLINPMTYNITINNTEHLLTKLKNIEIPNTVYIFEFPPYNLTIYVLNASDNVPIQNASVEILRFEDNSTLFSELTSIDGVAQFNLDPGKYYINLTYGAYNLIQFKEIIEDPLVSYHIPPYQLEVEVTDYWGSPLEDANVSINGGSPSPTNISGYVSFYLQPNVYNISASWYNYTELEIVDMTSYQENFKVTIRLAQKYHLNISVVNAISGRFLENATVQILEFGGDLINSKLTDHNGFCQFFLIPQVYNLSITMDESFEYQLINLTADDSVLFSIIPLYKLSIFTFDDSPTYYTNEVVVQVIDLSGQVLFQDSTDTLGECSFKLEYGTYNITLNKDSEHKSEIIDISRNEFLSFHMAPYKITVHVINSTTSLPIPNALVTIETQSGVEVISIESDQAGIVEFLLNSGDYLIYVDLFNSQWTKNIDLQQSNSSMQITFLISLDASSAIDVGDPREYSASLLQQTLGLTESIVYILAIILTILVSFSIMNVVSSSVSESRRHIGIIRSVGSSNRQVYFLINFRIVLISATAGVLGGLIGILLGSFISVAALEISLAQIVTYQLFFSLLFSAIGITLLIGMISANLTLYRLLKMPISSSIKEILPQTG